MACELFHVCSYNLTKGAIFIVTVPTVKIRPACLGLVLARCGLLSTGFLFGLLLLFFLLTFTWSQ